MTETSPLKTRNQAYAERAFRAVSSRGATNKEYAGYAKSFPALIHESGLAQAVAFAQAKGAGDGNAARAWRDLLTDLVAVVEDMKGENKPGPRDVDAFAERSRTAEVPDYLRLSRNALTAAVWIKRYAEALIEG